MTVTQRLDCRLYNVFRRLEVGLPDSKVNDVTPLTRECLGTGQNFKGCFRAQPLHLL